MIVSLLSLRLYVDMIFLFLHLSRLSLRPLKSFETRVLLEVLVQNFLPRFVITFSKQVGVNDEALKRHWRRCVSCALQYCFVIYIVKHIEDMIEVLFTFAGGKTASLY